MSTTRHTLVRSSAVSYDLSGDLKSMVEAKDIEEVDGLLMVGEVDGSDDKGEGEAEGERWRVRE